jgi:hypothetical protein
MFILLNEIDMKEMYYVHWWCGCGNKERTRGKDDVGGCEKNYRRMIEKGRRKNFMEK